MSKRDPWRSDWRHWQSVRSHWQPYRSNSSGFSRGRKRPRTRRGLSPFDVLMLVVMIGIALILRLM